MYAQAYGSPERRGARLSLPTPFLATIWPYVFSAPYEARILCGDTTALCCFRSFVQLCCFRHCYKGNGRAALLAGESLRRGRASSALFLGKRLSNEAGNCRSGGRRRLKGGK